MLRPSYLFATVGALLLLSSESQAAFTFNVTGVPTGTVGFNQDFPTVNNPATYSNTLAGAFSYSLSTVASEAGPVVRSLSTSLSITNFSGAAASFTISITQDNFSGVTNPVFWSTGYTISLVAGSVDSFSYTTSATGQSALAPVTAAGTGTLNGTPSNQSGPMSITHVFTVTNLANASLLNFNVNSTISSPAPASLLALGTGLPVLGMFRFVRRRKDAAAAV